MYFKMTNFLYAKIIFVFIVVYSETISSYRAQQLDLEEGKVVLITFEIIYYSYTFSNFNWERITFEYFYFISFTREINLTFKWNLTFHILI